MHTHLALSWIVRTMQGLEADLGDAVADLEAESAGGAGGVRLDALRVEAVTRAEAARRLAESLKTFAVRGERRKKS